MDHVVSCLKGFSPCFPPSLSVIMFLSTAQRKKRQYGGNVYYYDRSNPISDVDGMDSWFPFFFHVLTS